MTIFVNVIVSTRRLALVKIFRQFEKITATLCAAFVRWGDTRGNRPDKLAFMLRCIVPSLALQATYSVHQSVVEDERKKKQRELWPIVIMVWGRKKWFIQFLTQLRSNKTLLRNCTMVLSSPHSLGLYMFLASLTFAQKVWMLLKTRRVTAGNHGTSCSCETTTGEDEEVCNVFSGLTDHGVYNVASASASFSTGPSLQPPTLSPCSLSQNSRLRAALNWIYSITSMPM